MAADGGHRLVHPAVELQVGDALVGGEGQAHRLVRPGLGVEREEIAIHPFRSPFAVAHLVLPGVAVRYHC